MEWSSNLCNGENEPNNTNYQSSRKRRSKRARPTLWWGWSRRFVVMSLMGRNCHSHHDQARCKNPGFVVGHSTFSASIYTWPFQLLLLFCQYGTIWSSFLLLDQMLSWASRSCLNLQQGGCWCSDTCKTVISGTSRCHDSDLQPVVQTINQVRRDSRIKGKRIPAFCDFADHNFRAMLIFISFPSTISSLPRDYDPHESRELWLLP